LTPQALDCLDEQGIVKISLQACSGFVLVQSSRKQRAQSVLDYQRLSASRTLTLLIVFLSASCPPSSLRSVAHSNIGTAINLDSFFTCDFRFFIQQSS